MVLDSRKEFIAGAAASFFSVPAASVLASPKTEALNKFLDEASSLILTAKVKDEQVSFSSQIEADGKNEPMIVFYKFRPDVITPDNMHTNVFISSILDSPVNALYHSVQKVFGPALLDDKNRTFNPTLQGLLSDLQAGLGSAVRKQGLDGGRKDLDENSVAGILTPEDEFQFWQEVSSSKRSDRASQFVQLFQPIRKELADLEHRSLVEVVELIDVFQDSLDDVWKQPDVSPSYPEARMKHLMDVIGASLVQCVQSKAGQVDLWHGPYSTVKQALTSSHTICERWVQVCERLSGQLWKKFSPHPWKGEKFTPSFVLSMAGRVHEVLSVRAVHEQIAHLLGRQEQHDMRLSDLFTVFSSLNPLQYNPYTLPQWKSAVAQYHQALSPAERSVANKLRGQLQSLGNNPMQMLREFKRYQELVQLPGVRKELVSERETLLAQLSIFLKQTRDEFSQRSSLSAGGKTLSKGKNMPELVSHMVWVRQLEAKVKETTEIAEAVLSDLSGFPGYQKESKSLLDELFNWRREKFDDWTRDIQQQIDDPNQPISLEMSGKLMELNHKDGKLYVNYGERLVTLLREVRQLSSMGFTIPAKIQHTSNIGQKFYHHGIILKQVAHFYNTIDQQMLKCQQSMMLEQAMAFERIIKNPKAGSKSKSGEGVQVTWDNPDELDSYIKKLQTAAEQLMSENRKLRRCHFDISDKVVSLMNTDLLRQQQKWKDGLLDIRQIMANLVQQGIKESNMKPWKMHWDRQLYKALEHQYQLGLEALNENLSEIQVELVYRQQELQFRPPFEEIKAKYFRELKKFISIPSNFKGTGDTTEKPIFPIMIERNSKGLITCFQKADSLFAKLAEVKDRFKEWVVLGSQDMEAYVEKQLVSVADFERNFRALKIRGRDAEKLPL